MAARALNSEILCCPTASWIIVTIQNLSSHILSNVHAHLGQKQLAGYTLDVWLHSIHFMTLLSKPKSERANPNYQVMSASIILAARARWTFIFFDQVFARVPCRCIRQPMVLYSARAQGDAWGTTIMHEVLVYRCTNLSSRVVPQLGNPSASLRDHSVTHQSLT